MWLGKLEPMLGEASLDMVRPLLLIQDCKVALDGDLSRFLHGGPENLTTRSASDPGELPLWRPGCSQHWMRRPADASTFVDSGHGGGEFSICTLWMDLLFYPVYPVIPKETGMDFKIVSKGVHFRFFDHFAIVLHLGDTTVSTHQLHRGQYCASMRRAPGSTTAPRSRE